jgi:LPXTG-motif cell wall-anchored protein
MNTNTLLILGAFLIVAILYIMRRRVRQGRKKGTF